MPKRIIESPPRSTKPFQPHYMTLSAAVPQLFKSLVQRFPLATYPEPQPLGTDTEALLAKRKVYLSYNCESGNHKANASNSSNNFFTLCVYGLFEHQVDNADTRLLLATDPVCLFTQLSLIYKNNLRAPQLNDNVSSSSSKTISQRQNAIMIVSHHASVDHELPILLEDTNPGGQKTKFKRIARSNFAINELNLAKIENSKVYILVELIDQILYDAWVFTVITELTTEQILQLYWFTDDERPIVDVSSYYSQQTRSNVFNHFVLKDIIATLLKRQQFALRYPIIAENFHKWLPNYIPFSLDFTKGKSHKLSQEIEEIFGNLVSILKQLRGLLENKESGEDLGVFDLKLISYLVCVKSFLRGKKMYNIINDEYAELFDYCDAKLKYFA